MTDANSRQVALQNLREFQEMSYADVYALIRQKRFDEAKAKYAAVLESMDVGQFDAALNLNISTPHDNLLECMSAMAEKSSEPEKIRAVGFDLSAHAVYQDEKGRLAQGVEVSLYSEDVYDFANASDSIMTMQCESAASEWQGCFMDIESIGLDGLGAIVKQFSDHAQKQHNLQGIIENETGTAIVDPIAIARHVAKLLVAIEYHRYMAEFVAEVEVPSEMVFIIGEHDEIEVPIVFYRVGQQPFEAPPAEDLNAALSERVEEVAPLAQEPPQVEAPAIYASPEDEPVMQPAAEEALEAGEQLVSAAEAQVEETSLETPVVEEKLAEPTDNSQVEEIIEEPVSGAKALLGKPLMPKAFGQRSNEIFEDAENKTDKEETA